MLVAINTPTRIPSCGSVALCLIAGLALTGCSAKFYRASADHEAAKVIAQKTPLVPNMDRQFTIEQQTNIVLDGLRNVTQTNDFFGADANIELGASILSLEKSLDLAVKHSRTYQNRKEQLFLQALGLTLARHRYAPIFGANLHETYVAQAQDVERQIDVIVGDQVIHQQAVTLDHQHTLIGGGNFSFDQLLSTGGRIASDFTIDVVRFMTGDPRWALSSRFAATLTQPLLRGAGYKIALENLTQAERDFLYDTRDFVRFRQDFSVQVASSYYQVVQARDQVRNSWIGLQNFRLNLERQRAFAREGKTAATAVGRIEQAGLSTEGQWVDAVRNYRERLDQFKIMLGLPTDARIVLDDAELSKLAIVHPNIEIDEAVKVALQSRLDFYNQRDQLEDASRHTQVAVNSLQADLDVILGTSMISRPGNRPLALDGQRARWTAGLDLDLPLDRKAERNNYRASLIAYERAKRDVQLAVDQIKLDVNGGWRSLDQARRSYEIAEVGVRLSQRRVEEQELRIEVGGGATAQDLVDARLDLINALNQRTSALVRHTIARLQFWRDLGILYIKDNGQWQEAATKQ